MSNPLQAISNHANIQQEDPLQSIVSQDDVKANSAMPPPPIPSSPSRAKHSASAELLASPERRNVAQAFERAMLPPKFNNNNNQNSNPASPTRPRLSPRKSQSPFKKALQAAGNASVGARMSREKNSNEKSTSSALDSSVGVRPKHRVGTASDPATIPLPPSPTLRSVVADLTEQSFDLIADSSLINAAANISMSFGDDSVRRNDSIKIRANYKVSKGASASSSSSSVNSSPNKNPSPSKLNSSLSRRKSRAINNNDDSLSMIASNKLFGTDNHSGTWNQPNLLDESLDKSLINVSFGDSDASLNKLVSKTMDKEESDLDLEEQKKRTEELKKKLLETIDLQPSQNNNGIMSRRQSFAKSTMENGNSKDGNRTARPSLAKSMSISNEGGENGKVDRRNSLITPRPSLSNGRTTPTPSDYQITKSTTPEMKTPMSSNSTKVRNHSNSSASSRASLSSSTSVRRQSMIGGGATPMSSRPPVSGSDARRQSLMKATPQRPQGRPVVRGQSLIDEKVIRINPEETPQPTTSTSTVRKSISSDLKSVPRSSITSKSSIPARTSIAAPSTDSGRSSITPGKSIGTASTSRFGARTSISTTNLATSNSPAKSRIGSTPLSSVSRRSLARPSMNARESLMTPSISTSPIHSPAKSRIGSTPINSSTSSRSSISNLNSIPNTSPRKSLAGKALQQKLQQSQRSSVYMSPSRKLNQTNEAVGSSPSRRNGSAIAATPSLASRRSIASSSINRPTPASSGIPSRLSASRIAPPKFSAATPKEGLSGKEEAVVEKGKVESNEEEEGKVPNLLSSSSSSSSINSDSPMDISELTLDLEVKPARSQSQNQPSSIPSNLTSSRMGPSRIAANSTNLPMRKSISSIPKSTSTTTSTTVPSNGTSIPRIRPVSSTSSIPRPGGLVDRGLSKSRRESIQE